MKEETFFKTVKIGEINKKGYLRCEFMGGFISVTIPSGLNLNLIPGSVGLAEFSGRIQNLNVSFNGKEFSKTCLVPDAIISFQPEGKGAK